MKTKTMEVNLDLHWLLWNELPVMESIIRSIEGFNYDMVITSAKDGVHMKNSLHYKGQAIDIRCKDMKNVDLVCTSLRSNLSKYLDIVKENDHIHIEYDI